MIATLLLQSANGRLALGPIDLIIVVVYFILVLGLGLYLKKYTNTGEESQFIFFFFFCFYSSAYCSPSSDQDSRY